MSEQQTGKYDPNQDFERFLQQFFISIGVLEVSPGIRLRGETAEHGDRISVSAEWIDWFRKGTPMRPEFENQIDCPCFSRSLRRPDCPVGFGHDLGQMMREPALQYGSPVF